MPKINVLNIIVSFSKLAIFLIPVYLFFAYLFMYLFTYTLQ